MDTEYRQKLIEALAGLRNIHTDILGFVINVAMYGEFKEWNDATPLDTEVNFDLEFFEDSEDKNVLLLVELAKKVEEIYARITSENDISVSKVDEE